MAGKQGAVMGVGVVGVGADVSHLSRAAMPSGERRHVRGSELDVRQVGVGAIESLSTRCYPPPKHKDNNASQACGISAELAGSEAERSDASDRSNERASVSAVESTSESVGMSAHSAARARRGHGREAARDVGRSAHAGRAGHAAGRATEAERWLTLLAPEALPPGVERIVNDAHSKWYRVRLGVSPLTVVLEIEVWQGELWAHLAATGRTAAPTLGELGWCREVFLGDRKAIQVLPRKAEAFDAGLRTVHLYAPLESDALPSFSRISHPSFGER